MARRFNFGDEDTYVPSRFSPRVKRNFAFEENDERFEPKQRIGFMPEEEEEDDDPYGYKDIITRYRKELGSEQPALARYRQEIMNTPQMQDHDLGKWGRVGAALAGFGAGYQDPMQGVKVAREIREAPWQRALKQHETLVGNLGQEAEFEQDDRKNRMAGLKLELDSVKDRRTADTAEMNIKSQIERRREQTKAELERLGLDWRKYDLDRLDKLSDNERADLLARETGRHNRATEGTANFNAQTSRGQLGVARDRFRFESGPKFNEEVQTNMHNRFMDEQEEAGRNERDRTGSASWLAPNVQRDAEDAASLEIYRDSPQYRDFFIPDDEGYISLKKDLTPAQLASPEFKELELEIANRVNSKLNTRRGGSRYQRVQ
jgi:hypothetical protein